MAKKDALCNLLKSPITFNDAYYENLLEKYRSLHTCSDKYRKQVHELYKENPTKKNFKTVKLLESQ